MKTRVGFIGLGLMGNPMAKNILKSGFPLIVYNRTPSKAKEMEKLGASVAKTPAQVAEHSDIVVLMVTAPKDVEEVLFNKFGVVKKAKKGLVVIDMGTIGPTAAREIAKKLAKYDIEFIDAPVTGSTPKAVTGELTIFVGGKKEIFEKVKPILLAMGKTLHYIGSSGSGQAVKLVNNFLVAADTIALSEAVILGEGMNLPREKIAEVLTTATGWAPVMNLAMPNFITKKFPVRFSLANLKKDVSLAHFESGKVKLPTLKQAKRLYDEAFKQKLGNEDFSAIIKIIQPTKD